MKFEDFRDKKFLRIIRNFDTILIPYEALPEIIKELTRLQESITKKKEYLNLNGLEKKLEKHMRAMNDGE